MISVPFQRSTRPHPALRWVCALVLPALLWGSSPAWAARYTLMDGDTIAPETAALLLRGGYPESSLAFIFSPAAFINLGFAFDVAYDPSFALRVPLKVQLLESRTEAMNLAAVVSPAVWFAFDGKDATVHAWFDPGLAGGIRFHRLLGWFLDLRYVVQAPVSREARFSHFPQIESGFEVGTGTSLNVIAGGRVRFVDYEPRRFGYGGHLGLGVSLW